MIRTTETAALAVLRAVEDEGAKRRAAAIVVHVAGAVALYVLNHKRQRLAEIEARYGMSVAFAADESLMPPQTRIERVRPHTGDALPAPTTIPISPSTPEEDDLVVEEADTDDDEAEAVDENETELTPANETGGGGRGASSQQAPPPSPWWSQGGERPAGRGERRRPGGG